MYMGGFKRKEKKHIALVELGNPARTTASRVLLESKASQRNKEWCARGRSKGSQGCLILEKINNFRK